MKGWRSSGPHFLHPILMHKSPVQPSTPWEHPHTLISIPGHVLTTTFPPLDNSHFLQMWEFLKHPSGLQDGNLIVV